MKEHSHEANHRHCVAAARSSLSAVGCGGGGAAAPPKAPADAQGRSRRCQRRVSVEGAQASSTTALDGVRRARQGERLERRDLRATSRRSSSTRPRRRSRESREFPRRIFNAGLAYQRCNNDKEAKAKFERRSTDDPKFHHARAQLALYQYKGATQRGRGHRPTLQQAVTDAQFQNVPALVNLAMFQMKRDARPGRIRTAARTTWTARRRTSSARSPSTTRYMPAFNQLALYYFQLAKKRAGAVSRARREPRPSIVTQRRDEKRADVQQLELAALVCSQAIRKNPNYAPIHNTAGLIQNELGQVNGAVAGVRARRRSSIRSSSRRR